MNVEVLIVDDLKDNLLALNAILERPDVNVRQALSGAAALELMMKYDFSLAILDVKMPGMSGFELAEFMRSTKKTKSIPIIFVTATATEQNFSFKGYESGAVDFLLKPLDTHAVKSKVNIFIELDRQKKELGEQLETISELMNDLKRSKDEAERANASKTEFLAHMSHEIRTPIGAILGFSDLLKSPGNSNQENLSYMAIVERNSHQLLRLIDDILDLSKVEAGKTTIENVEFSLSEMLADLNSSMAMRAREKKLDYRFTMSTLVPNLVCSDLYRLRQILNNVIGNAIKFTDTGFVEVDVSSIGSKLQFDVSDSGVGISKEQEDRLFQPFAQADSSTTRRFGGSGLGLILSRRLAENLGGNLELISAAVNEKRTGCTFRITIECIPVPHAKLIGKDEIKARAPQARAQSDGKQLAGLKVLLVEDSPDNQALISLYLKKEGAHVTTAPDGAKGVEMALTDEFNVVLMDIQMPVLDGHSAARKLRASSYSKPVIALTAHAMLEERAKCIESGFTDFLTKPIKRDLLIETLSQFRAAPGVRAGR